jgi:hypothetical protein
MKVTELLDNSSDDYLFEMANLKKSTSGLPRIVFISTKGRAEHSARIKVNRTTADRYIPDDVFSVQIDEPMKIDGNIKGVSADDIRDIEDWIKLNYRLLITYWNGNISTEDMLDKVKPLL